MAGNAIASKMLHRRSETHFDPGQRSMDSSMVHIKLKTVKVIMPRQQARKAYY
jgi:hypothetical protein